MKSAAERSPIGPSNLPGAEEAVKDLTQMLSLGTARTSWRTPIIKTVATNGTGVDDLVAAIQNHRAWAAESGEARRRTTEAMRSEIQLLLRERVLRDLAQRMDSRGLDDVVMRVVDKTLDPYAAVEALLEGCQ